MSSITDELDRIKTLISSPKKPEKSTAYSSLLLLIERMNSEELFMESLVASSRILIGAIVVDVGDEDEEISVQALKCLGFMIYHPALVASITRDTASVVVESLGRIIMTTKVKSVCNLAVWCISMQQLDSSVLATHFDSLLRAVVKAIDNPFGSLSTTFEAIQALMKLGTQLSQKMKESSCMWAPAMYRRLLSSDKREKEMCQRCLLRIKPVMLPPSLTLSKVMVRDLKSTLLTGLMELLKKGKKLQALQAWGWFIRLVGSLALKNKNLVNEMLKVPQQTFADQDSQVQIASLIAWEGLTDALIYLPSAISDVTNPRICRAQKEVSATSSQFNGSEVERLAFLKSLKLIMTPLTGIMSSKCDIAVKSSCFNTWCYLLQTLASFVNDPDVVIQVLEPILTAVFRGGPESRNIWFWHFCVSMLDDFIEARNENINGESSGPTFSNLLSEKTAVKLQMSEGTLQKHYSIKWLPWDCCHLEFVLRIIDIIITGVMTASVPVESKVMAYATTARTFRSFLKGAQNRFKKCSSGHDAITESLRLILMTAKKICEDASSKNDCDDELVVTCLQLLKSVAEELHPSILDSPLYMVPLDFKVVTGTQLR